MDGEEQVMRPAVDAEGKATTQPEHGLEARDPEMEGAAPPVEKKGMVGKVKDLMARKGRRKKRSDEKKAAMEKGGVFQKFKVKAGSKVDDALSSGSSSMSSSDEEDIGTVGFAMDPTGPVVAGSTLGRQDYSNAPTRPGANFNSLTLDEDDEDVMHRHSERAAEYSETSNPMGSKYGQSLTTPSEEDDASRPSQTGNSHLTPSDDAPANPEGGPGVAGEHHGKDGAKEEGFMQRMLNKVY